MPLELAIRQAALDRPREEGAGSGGYSPAGYSAGKRSDIGYGTGGYGGGRY